MRLSYTMRRRPPIATVAGIGKRVSGIFSKTGTAQAKSSGAMITASTEFAKYRSKSVLKRHRKMLALFCVTAGLSGVAIAVWLSLALQSKPVPSSAYFIFGILWDHVRWWNRFLCPSRDEPVGFPPRGFREECRSARGGLSAAARAFSRSKNAAFTRASPFHTTRLPSGVPLTTVVDQFLPRSVWRYNPQRKVETDKIRF